MEATLNATLGELKRLYGAADFAAAAELGWALLREDPFDAVVLNLLALVEAKRGNAAAGVVLLQRAVKAEPTNFLLWNDLGTLHFAIGAIAAAEGAYRRAIALNYRCAEAYSNLASIYLKRCEYAGAREELEKALAIRPRYAEALYNLGNALTGMGEFEKALRRYQQAHALKPEHAGTNFNLGITRLVLGKLTAGWAGWEWRWRATLAPYRRNFAEPAWTGECLDGRRILLHAEQGIGDTLQFLRYVPLVAECGAEIVLEVQATLVPLLHGYPQVKEVVARGDALPRFDVQCSLMSLGAIFETTLATIPSERLHFQNLPTVMEREAGPLRVGLVWAGNPTHVRDQDRSMPLAAFAPLLDVDGVRWVSLQKGVAAEQLAAAGVKFRIVQDWAADFADFVDMAKAMRGLDLVITVDTSAAHLAGAMGKPVWVLLAAVPDWRWLLKRRDSPWYSTARLFRQSGPGDWAGVMECVRKELQMLAHTHALLRSVVEVADGGAV